MRAFLSVTVITYSRRMVAPDTSKTRLDERSGLLPPRGEMRPWIENVSTSSYVSFAR